MNGAAAGNGSLDFLDQLGPRADNGDVDVYSSASYLAFGVSRKAWGGEPMIDFVFRDGNHHGMSYARLDDMQFNPSRGIVLRFSDTHVTIVGRRLEAGYERLLAHRVVFVAEADHATQLAGGELATVVTNVVFASRREISALTPNTRCDGAHAEIG
jgi:hypothetical protein